MSMLPEEDTAAAINAAAVGVVLGTDLFISPPQQVQVGVPSRAVFCYQYGGYAVPLRYLQGPPVGGDAGLQNWEPRVSIITRSSRHDYAGGLALARAVRKAIHDLPPTGYYGGRVQEVDPTFLYQTDNGEFVFIMNYHLWYDGAPPG